MLDIDAKTLRLFVAACDLRNMKAAAAQEHIEPSAISKRIALLEERLGAALLVRGRRGVHPTPAGEAMLEHARNVLFSMARMRSDVEAFAGGVRGQVTVAASASAIAESLLDDLAAFMREPAYRQIRVVVEERFSRDIVRLVREGGAALGVCWDSVDFEGLQQRPYRGDELTLAVPRGHPLARRRRVSLVQALAHEHVGLPPAAAAHMTIARAAAQAGATVNYRAIVSTFDAALRVVSAGLAVSIVPGVIVQRAGDPGLVSVPLAEPWVHRRFAICHRSEVGQQPAAARLLEYLNARAEALA